MKKGLIILSSKSVKSLYGGSEKDIGQIAKAEISQIDESGLSDEIIEVLNEDEQESCVIK